MSKLIGILALFLLVEWYFYTAIRTVLGSRYTALGSLLLSIFFIGYIVYLFLNFDRKIGQTQHTLWVLAGLVLYLSVKFFVAIPLFLEDLFRLFKMALTFLKADHQPVSIPSRRKFISQMALCMAALPLSSVLYGIFEGKYHFKVIRKALFYNDLPQAFNGFKVLQISDMHIGSFDDASKIEYAVNLINQQDFDLLVFTGDLVNNFAKEVDPWVSILSKIKTPTYGKYAILGNHDYGEYALWDSMTEKQKNFEQIKEMYAKLGFELLLNQHIFIEKQHQKIALIGVENWGHNFKKAGDLDKASKGLRAEDFKILLSHDPSHFDLEVKEHQLNFQLTLSGHTHGMQFGVEIPGIFKWSPSQWVYKHWAGLYQESGRFLYVNRGFGFHAYSGRVGIWPEITIIELKK